MTTALANAPVGLVPQLPGNTPPGSGQYLTFTLQNEVYGLDILRVREILEYTRPTTVPMMPAFVHGVIDLRGNQGGSLQAARQCAALFLDKGALLYSLRFREKADERVTNDEQQRFITSRILLLQDTHTASSAEMFIAALTGNGQAFSLGERTFGKGLVQRFFRLSDGSALLLTHAELLAPSGAAFNGQGLEPDLPLPKEMIGMDFMADDSMAKLLGFVQDNHH